MFGKLSIISYKKRWLLDCITGFISFCLGKFLILPRPEIFCGFFNLIICIASSISHLQALPEETLNFIISLAQDFLTVFISKSFKEQWKKYLFVSNLISTWYDILFMSYALHRPFQIVMIFTFSIPFSVLSVRHVLVNS